jgi:ribosomal protein S27AE
MKVKEKVCARCGRRFIAAAKARYCSAACKQAAYRERRDRMIVTL